MPRSQLVGVELPAQDRDGGAQAFDDAFAERRGTFDRLHDLELPVIPPFEGRGFALEYLLKSALADASLADETMLDLVDPAATREAQGLDMLMLLAS